MSIIIKRKGHTEPFDERKVYASCYAACLNAHRIKEDAERIASWVTDSIKKWIEIRKEVSSDNIFRAIVDELRTRDPDAAFLYETHRDVS